MTSRAKNGKERISTRLLSSGANVYSALKVAKKLGRGANVVTVLVDRRERYFPESPQEHYVI